MMNGIVVLIIMCLILFISTIALGVRVLLLKDELDLARFANGELKEELNEIYSRPRMVYECDRKECAICGNPLCNHTFNIEHAVNFKKEGDFYVEKLRHATAMDVTRDLDILHKED